MIEIQIDLSVIRDLQMLQRQMPLAVAAGLKRAGEHTQQIAIRETGKIYARTIPLGKRNRKPKWKRSGDLLDSIRSPLLYGKADVSLKSDVVYAKSRHGLGVDWQPHKPALGIVRRNPFFSDTQEKVEPQIGPLFEQGFGEVLGL